MKTFINKGFTFIELIIVISIISIITLIAMPNYLKYREYVIREETLNIGKGIYLSAVDYYFINSKDSISGDDIDSMKKFIQEDVGLPIISVDKIKSSVEHILDIKYYYKANSYKCEVNLNRNKCKIFYIKNNSENLIYQNY
ncbi:prepilin-type N-terminal cleavage/methylation domain-containing protein [Clostridium sp. KNHs214]|uniref:prepilin-type N-terminal cleavage/methylation domain-containing protein n=1 Tax=Clostridium sp. KNHs214 TaxID=1540257 RepID=UPI00055389C2|nr:prepilin-type N-terminal cleavage/methylation domain-containing protein [Clostridium sp. KNHs214]